MEYLFVSNQTIISESKLQNSEPQISWKLTTANHKKLPSPSLIHALPPHEDGVKMREATRRGREGCSDEWYCVILRCVRSWELWSVHAAKDKSLQSDCRGIQIVRGPGTYFSDLGWSLYREEPHSKKWYPTFPGLGLFWEMKFEFAQQFECNCCPNLAERSGDIIWHSKVEQLLDGFSILTKNWLWNDGKMVLLDHWLILCGLDVRLLWSMVESEKTLMSCPWTLTWFILLRWSIPWSKEYACIMHALDLGACKCFMPTSDIRPPWLNVPWLWFCFPARLLYVKCYMT